MDIRQRRRRRIGIILAVVLVVAAGITGVILLRQWKQTQQNEYLRTAGIEAFEQGNPAQAVEHLSAYLTRESEDVEALYTYARASLKVPQPHNRHVGQALGSLSQVVKLDPDHPQAPQELLGLRTLVGQNDEALELAEAILKRDPQNTTVLSSKTVVLMRMDQPEAALATAQQALQIDPDLHELHLISLQLRHQLEEPVDQLVADAQALQQANENDPRYEMVLGYAYALANDSENAEHWLRSAARRELTNEQFAHTLLGVLDRAELFEESLALLERAGANPQWRSLKTELARRLFESRQFEQVVERLSDINPSDPDASVDAVALRSMALHHLERQDEAEQIRAALAARERSVEAQLWASVLDEVYAEDRQPTAIIEVCQEALATVPGNAYFHAFLGDAYASVGDNELALGSWRSAAQLRQSWGAIRGQIARTLLAAGQAHEAAYFAGEAYRREPDQVDPAITWIRARAATVNEPDSAAGRELLGMIDRVQQAIPGEPQTLLLRVRMLSEMGRRDEASAAILSILDSGNDLNQGQWLQLVGLSQEYDLGLDDRLLDRVEQQEGETAELAVVRATELARQGRAAEGLSLIEAGLEAATQEQRPAWQLARAVYLDTIEDPQAKQAWALLIDAHPDNTRVQQMALHAQAVRGDRELTRRVLGLLQNLLGENSVTWRIEQARYLVESPDVQQDSAAAVPLLRRIIEDAPKRVDPRLLLVQALEQLGREEAALAELRTAEQAIPNSVPIMLNLARLHHEARQFSEVDEYLDRVVNHPAVTVREQREAIMLLARQGKDREAIDLLERLQSDPDTAQDEQRIMLASLYHRAGDSDHAARLLEESLANPTPDVFTFALEFYQSRNQPENLQRVLSMLETAAIPEHQRQQILGDFYAGIGDTQQAASIYRDRVRTSPQDPQAWRQLVAMSLASGEVDAAIQAADQGLEKLPDEPALRLIRDHAETLRQLAARESARGLMVTLATEPQQGPVAAEALKLIAQTDGSASSAAEAVAAMRPLADRHERSLPLQTATVRMHMQAGQLREAAELASRAARLFPTAAEPAGLHTEALAAMGQWLEALGAASEWRSRTIGSTLTPDLMIVEAHLKLDAPARAMTAIQPHLPTALAAPASNPQVISRYARILVAQNRAAEAAQVLMPLLSSGAHWRVLVMDLAASGIQDAAEASRWLEQVQQYVADDAQGEQLALAQSYWALSQRLNDPAAAEHAVRAIERLTSQPQAPAAAWYMHGMMAEGTGDLAAAEAAYRRAIERSDGLAAAKNNLAMVLIRRGEEATPGGVTQAVLNEARHLAEAAVGASPANVYFLDTLATVQARAGQVDEAVATMNRAIELDPENDTWKRNLAQILKDSGRDDEAQQILDQLQRRSAHRP